jgi:hypothetical protein
LGLNERTITHDLAQLFKKMRVRKPFAGDPKRQASQELLLTGARRWDLGLGRRLPPFGRRRA